MSSVMIRGVSARGWWMAEMSALFLASGILVGLVIKALLNATLGD